MNLHTLPSLIEKRKKRLGRGIGSGKGGHTASRGQKGQKSRRHIGEDFFGTKMKKSLLKRLPMQRGKMKLKPGIKPIAISSDRLLTLPKGAVIDIETLVKAEILDKKETYCGAKIIKGVNEINKPLNLKLPATKGVIELITRAGGTVNV